VAGHVVKLGGALVNGGDSCQSSLTCPGGPGQPQDFTRLEARSF